MGEVGGRRVGIERLIRLNMGVGALMMGIVIIVVEKARRFDRFSRVAIPFLPVYLMSYDYSPTCHVYHTHLNEFYNYIYRIIEVALTALCKMTDYLQKKQSTKCIRGID